MRSLQIINSFIQRYKWTARADRLGPDMLATHFQMFIPVLHEKICRRKFKTYKDGADFRIGAYAINCSNINLGKNVVIRPQCMLIADNEGEIVIKDDVLIAPGVHIYVNNHEFARIDIPINQQGYTPSQSVVIEEGAWIGANVVILPGVKIGKNAVIGAGSIVTKSIDSYCLAVGNPAKVIKEFR
ncbi:acyltransferase [Sporosarcina newyorkensis]|uniref:acyltransferase n=1 Tax=Sporosarcina newyorkensis TaxID=759851 RepID=UPI003D06F025